MADQIIDALSSGWQFVSQSPGVALPAIGVVVATTFGFTKWWFGSIVSEKDAKIGHLEERIKLRDDQLSGKFDRTTPDEALELIRQLELQISDIRRSGFSVVQLQVLRQSLSSELGGPFRITLIRSGVAEDPMYAQLLRLFSSLGNWKPSPGLQIGPEGPPCGLAVIVADKGKLTEAESRLLKGLQEANVKFELLDGRTNDTDVELQVSLKID